MAMAAKRLKVARGMAMATKRAMVMAIRATAIERKRTKTKVARR